MMKAPLLPDTSAWIDFLRNQDSYLRRRLAAGDGIHYTQPILMEILAGARDDREWLLLRRFVTGATLIPFEAVADFEGAAWIYRRGQQLGLHIGHVDCLVLAVAQRANATLVTADRRQAVVGESLGISVKRTKPPA